MGMEIHNEDFSDRPKCVRTIKVIIPYDSVKFLLENHMTCDFAISGLENFTVGELRQISQMALRMSQMLAQQNRELIGELNAIPPN